MISSQEGTDARRERPPAAFLAGRSRAAAGGCCGGAAVSSSGPASLAAVRVCAAACLRSGSGSGWAIGPGACATGAGAIGASLGAMGVTVARGAGAGLRGAGGRSASGSESRAPWVEDPLGHVRPPARREHQLHLPVAVRALARVPLGVLGDRPELGEALGDDVAEPRPGPGVAGLADRRTLRLFGAVRPLREHRAFEPADPLDRHSGSVSDLVRRLSGTDPVLDLLGSQGTLHFDLVLSEPGELPACHDP
jgi:hypothetical protein